MKIKKDLVVKIFKYLEKHKDFYFPFSLFCKEFIDKNGDLIEVNSDNLSIIKSNRKYRNFELVENLQDLRADTTKLMARGFIEAITGDLLRRHINSLVKNYRKAWKKDLCESEDIEEYGLNEFIGGKAEAYEECLSLVKEYNKFL